MDVQGQGLLNTNSTDENDKLLQAFFYHLKKKKSSVSRQIWYHFTSDLYKRYIFGQQ